MRNIIVKELIQKPIEEQEIEIVERKGLGHPDSLSDGIAESVSRALCQAYKEKFGEILHHNTDEVQITAGESYLYWGGGKIINPIEILLTGRGVSEKDGKKMDIDKISIKAAEEYLNEKIINLDVQTSSKIECKIRSGSGDLLDVYNRDKIPSSNDTSFGVGFAPFSETEKIVMAIENHLNSKSFKKNHPQIGEDIKVMGLRENNKIILTTAVAMVSKYIDDRDTYINIKEELNDIIIDLVLKKTDREVETYLNAGDNNSSKTEKGYYLTVTGTSAEMGDDGSVGRGNRANGLITPNRPMSMEATSGKNPINHVGKIYNLLSNKMAEEISKEIDLIKQIHILLLNQIGKPIDHPKVASAQIIVEDDCHINSVNKDVEEIMNKWLEDITKITEMILEDKIRTF